jgi:hypothetical protein
MSARTRPKRPDPPVPDRRPAWRSRVAGLVALVSSVALVAALLSTVSAAWNAKIRRDAADRLALVPARPFARGVWLLLGPRDNRSACDAPGTGHYRYIVVQWYATHDPACPLARIRAANPGAKLLAYQNIGAMIAGPHVDGRPSTCVTQEEAAAHDRKAPGDAWSLHDRAGKALTYSDYHYLTPANVGRVSYERQCARHFPRIRADGYDGVFADDVNVYPGHSLGESGRTPIAEYPTDAAYGDAMTGAIHLLGPTAHLENLLFMPSVGMNPWMRTHRERALSIAHDSSGLFREFWMRWNGPGPNLDGVEWEANARLQQAVEGLGRAFVASTVYGPSPTGAPADQQYGVASFWVMWNGTQDSAWGFLVRDQPGRAFSDIWGPDLGRPVDNTRQRVGVGWLRRYTGGIAIVNPNRSHSQRFHLGRAYRRVDGSMVSSVMLRPTTGMVLSLP